MSSVPAPPLAAMITPAQCRAARALLGWRKEWLASESSISSRAIAEGLSPPFWLPRRFVIVSFL
jgi:hypothetical protein